MPTVFARITNFQNQNSRALPIDLPGRSAVGAQVREAWFSLPNRGGAALHRIKSVEPEGTFKVLSYPKFFVPVMDQVIADYFKANGLMKPRPRRKL